MKLPFVDAHIHLWDLDHLRYAWLTPPFSTDGPNGSCEAIATTYLPRHYAQDSAKFNVIGAVHVDAGADAKQALDETKWLQSLADQGDNFPQGIVAFAGLNDPEVEGLLAQQAAFKNVRGIRQIINWHPNPNLTYTPKNRLDDDQFHKGYALLGKYNLSFDLQIYPLQLPQATSLAARHEHVPVILNHAGMPVNDRDDAFDYWANGMMALAALPHAYAKISGLGIVQHDWTTESIRPYVLKTIDIFGTKRCLFASDVPTDKLYSDFDTILNAFDEITRDFSEDERRDMFGRNACRAYRLGLSL